MYTFSELKKRVSFLLQRKDDTDYETEVETWINMSLEELYNIYDYYHELKSEHNFTTVDGTALYYMPQDFGLPLRFYDVTNNKPITIITEEQYFDSNIANVADSVENDADSAYFKEVVGVKVQVSTSGDTVKVNSSNSVDTTQIVRVEGYIDSNLTIVGYENITLNGTTDATATSSLTFYKILHFSKSADTTGFITLEDSSSNELATLGPIDRVSRYKAFRLGLIPDDSTTNMRVLYKKRYNKLVNAYDYPFVESDNFLIWNSVAIGRFQEKESAEGISFAQSKAESAKAEILAQQNTKLGPSYQHKMNSRLLQAHRSG